MKKDTKCTNEVREFFENIIAQPKEKGRFPKRFDFKVVWGNTLISAYDLSSSFVKVRSLPEYNLFRAIHHIDTIGEHEKRYYLVLVENSAPLFVVSDSRYRNNVMFFTDDVNALTAHSKYLNQVCCGLTSFLIRLRCLPEFDCDSLIYQDEQRKLKLTRHEGRIHHTKVPKAIELIQKMNCVIKRVDSTVFIQKPVIY
jgi:hypothetical protein